MGEIQREPILENEEEDTQAELDVWKYVFGFGEMAVVKCAIELGIADAIESHGDSMTLSELSSALACSPSQLYRILRFLMHRNIFKQTPNNQGPIMLAPWHALSTRALANGMPSFEKAHGEDLWSYGATNLAHTQLFNEAMACNARLMIPAIFEGCGEVFDGLGSLVDVGGGNGTAMGLLVKACPWIKGINFDLPHVVSGAPNCDGVEHVGGDMFQSVPKADAAFIMNVLHDWGDEECIQVLKKCREAIPKQKGKIIIIDPVVEEDNKTGDYKLNDFRLMLDMVMMAHTNTGKERTMKEWEYIIKEAGFNQITVKPIRAVQSVIIAFP
ncbi:putative O-methyltransferase [Quillaja saponaria]|uniref:O-methyltransferase n=1 Tax=Quillaja saponaria TaxID=32244 RepID=A0AAD7PHT3_QUISA|nr:putative O-methyltransferase [Quillaja saponaria]